MELLSPTEEYVPLTPPTSVSVAATDGFSLTPTSSLSPGSTTAYSAMSPYPTQQVQPSDGGRIYPHASRQIPLVIQVRKWRILIITTVIITVLMLIIRSLDRGVRIARASNVVVTTNNNNNSENYKMLLKKVDDLNFYFGTTASFLAKPFELAAAFILPVVILIFVSEESMLNDSMAWRMGILLAQACCIGFLTNSFTTTYVVVPRPTVTKFVMTQSDLLHTVSFATAAGAYKANATVPRRSSTDTILRTAMRPPYVRPTQAKCWNGDTNSKAMAASFGFYTNDWLPYMVNTGIKMDASLNVTVRDWLNPTASHDLNKTNDTKQAQLPFSITTGANLVIHAMNLLVDRLEMPLFSASTVDPLEQFTSRATAAEQNHDNEGFLHVTAAMLNSTLTQQHEFGFFFAPEQAKIQFSSFNLPSLSWLVFDAITIELPFQPGHIRRHLEPTQFDTLRDTNTRDTNDTNNGDVAVYQVSPATECGTRGCWLPQPNNSREHASLWKFRPQVVAYSRCSNTFHSIGANSGFTACQKQEIAENSIVVGAIGSTLTADRMVVFDGDGFTPFSKRVRRANITNVSRTLSITLGFLTWKLGNLSSMYGAECSESAPFDCGGLSYPLSSEQVVLLDKSRIIVNDLQPIASRVNAGQPLVSIVTNLPDGGVPFPLRNIQEQPVDVNSTWPCSRDLEFITDSIEYNRWYLDHSLQDAYTAALFHVFQFGVNRSATISLNRSATNETFVKSSANAAFQNPQLSIKLSLDGNEMAYEFYAQIPSMAATTSYLACGFFLISVFVVVCTSKQRGRAIQEVTDVQRVARVHLVEQFFPKLFLQCTVFDTPRGQPLAPFRIVAMTLHRATPMGNIYLSLPGTKPEYSDDGNGEEEVRRSALSQAQLAAMEQGNPSVFNSALRPVESVAAIEYNASVVWQDRS